MEDTQLPLFQRKTHKGIISGIEIAVRPPAEEMTVLQALPAYHRYLTEREFSQYTPNDFTGDLKKFGVFVREKHIKEITTKEVKAWILLLITPTPKEEGLSVKTVSWKLTAFVYRPCRGIVRRECRG